MRIIGNAGKAREVQAVASGALSTGDTVIVNSDGTVSVVAETSVSQSLGSATTYDSSRSTIYSSVAFDSSNNKAVVVYADNDAPQYGYAVVGTVSGTSISFGTPVVFHSDTTTETFVVFDSSAGKVVVTYKDNGAANHGKAIVGTVSGTSISFGSEATFNAGDHDYPKAAFDSTSNKVIVTYRDGSNSDYGTAIVGTVSGTSISFGSEVVFISTRVDFPVPTYDSVNDKIVVAYRDFGARDGYAKVGTVSGTSISFGSATQFESGQTNEIAAAYDTQNQTVVIAYQDANDSLRGKAVVGAVSGTSISFGSNYQFETGGTYQISVAYDATAKKTVVAYSDDGNGAFGTFVIGTVSGDTLSFTSPSVFESANTAYTAMAYNPDEKNIIITYRDNDNSLYGTAIVLQNAASIPNLAPDNYIGTAATGTPDGKAAKINIKGAVDENQSGLTSGQSYYVQTDGTLGTTPADPSVFAGTAVAANKLIVKG